MIGMFIFFLSYDNRNLWLNRIFAPSTSFQFLISTILALKGLWQFGGTIIVYMKTLFRSCHKQGNRDVSRRRPILDAHGSDILSTPWWRTSDCFYYGLFPEFTSRQCHHRLVVHSFWSHCFRISQVKYIDRKRTCLRTDISYSTLIRDIGKFA